jgi:hypothetical protein
MNAVTDLEAEFSDQEIDYLAWIHICMIFVLQQFAAPSVLELVLALIPLGIVAYIVHRILQN